MIATVPSPIHTAFLDFLPALRAHARARFRHRPPADREEAAADAVAYAFAAYLALRRRGKDPTAFPAAFARFAALAVANGRAVGRRAASRDALARRPGRPPVDRLDGPAPGGGWWRDAVADPRAAVARQAAFNVDFPAWLSALPPLKRRVAGLLARGHGTGDAARRAGVTPGRVSQLRRELAASWAAFHAGPVRLHPRTTGGPP